MGENGNEKLLVTDQVCEARLESIKTQIQTSETRVIGRVKVVDGKLDIIIKHYKEKMNEHEKSIGSLKEKTNDAEIQIERILQWKANGEKKKEVTFKTMTIAIGIAVGSVGLFSNMQKIIAFIVKLSAIQP